MEERRKAGYSPSNRWVLYTYISSTQHLPQHWGETKASFFNHNKAAIKCVWLVLQGPFNQKQCGIYCMWWRETNWTETISVSELASRGREDLWDIQWWWVHLLGYRMSDSDYFIWTWISHATLCFTKEGLSRFTEPLCNDNLTSSKSYCHLKHIMPDTQLGGAE